MSSRCSSTTLIFASLAGIAVLAAWPGGAGAQVADAADRGRVSATFGLALWSELGDVQALSGGDFDEAGFAVDLAFHWPVGQIGSATMLAGANLGGVFHGSNIRGLEEGEDLEASALYLTPSLKLAFGKPGERRFYLDAGAGYYAASIDELEDDCFFSCDVYEYYDDDTFGGYVGLGADFPFGGRSGSFRLATSIQAHFVDFDDPFELDGSATLGGPIYTLQIGVAWLP